LNKTEIRSRRDFKMGVANHVSAPLAE